MYMHACNKIYEEEEYGFGVGVYGRAWREVRNFANILNFANIKFCEYIKFSKNVSQNRRWKGL